MENQVIGVNQPVGATSSSQGVNISLYREEVKIPRYVNAIREATEFLPNMDVSKKSHEDGLHTIEANVRKLSDEDEDEVVKNVSKALFVAGMRVGIPGKDLFSFLPFLPELLGKMPSTSEQETQDKALIKKSEDLKAYMTMIKNCFENLGMVQK
ncbi:MAG: hypothetical protein H0T62_12140 [Parachlamydiaceae bacterium]|nr:hypothetical protein [Parachlamydiaceae bacterium]